MQTNELDLRRFQVDLKQPFAMDDITKIARLTVYGEELGRMILKNRTDRSQEVKTALASHKAGF